MSVFSSLHTFFKRNIANATPNVVENASSNKKTNLKSALSKKHLPEETYNRLVQLFDINEKSLSASRNYFEQRDKHYQSSSNHLTESEATNTIETSHTSLKVK